MFRRSLVQLPAALLRRSAPCRAAASVSQLRALPTLSRSLSSSAAAPSAPSAADSESHSDFAPQYKQSVSTSLEEARQAIEKDIAAHPVFVYMKGSPDSPKCGFSANVCRILNAYPGVKYGSRDVLEDEFVRQAIKQFSDWPTLPQVFVKGEFVGGSDIVGNMYKSGELDKLLGATAKPL